ncbi:hypothetical protein BDW74DRAFT_179348 [Aspergillus multicolor]|uniref:uncharacterized protein n=1 Tax=Aspergillus multicolor TaxID=41759 RepID=UPI003CCCAD52
MSNTSNSSIIPLGNPRCASHANDLPSSLPPSTSYCATPVYLTWNTTNKTNTSWITASAGNDPVTSLKECCALANEDSRMDVDVGYFGPENCTAYCNITAEAKGDIEQCISHMGAELGVWRCVVDESLEGGARGLRARTGKGGWGGFIVLGVVVGSFMASL